MVLAPFFILQKPNLALLAGWSKWHVAYYPQVVMRRIALLLIISFSVGADLAP